MNTIDFFRKIYFSFWPEKTQFGRNWGLFPQKDYASKTITNLLNSPNAVMIARFGANELRCMVNYLGVRSGRKNCDVLSVIKGQAPEPYWNENNIKQLVTAAGFFPKNTADVERFSNLMIEDIGQVDLLGSWLKEEIFFGKELLNTKRVMLEDLEPFFVNDPWTKALAGRKVLVVHPFSKSIQYQYARRNKIFDQEILPDFELKTFTAVQTIAGKESGFASWFDALEFMKNEIENIDFDICILGCGAYGFPLAAHIKRMGRKAIHLGGVTQLLFGIRGKRWEDYVVYPYSNLFNEYWIRPDAVETPEGASKIEGGCYW